MWASLGWKCACCNLQMRSFFSLHYYILYIITDCLASLYVLFNFMVNFAITWIEIVECYVIIILLKKNCSPVLVINKLVPPLILWHILIYWFTSSFVSCCVRCLILYIVIILHFFSATTVLFKDEVQMLSANCWHCTHFWQSMTYHGYLRTFFPLPILYCSML